jgi:hypothetical protein
MTDKKIQKRHKDQEKQHHRDAVKGHRTRKHFINSVRDEEADKEIIEETIIGTETIQDHLL